MQKGRASVGSRQQAGVFAGKVSLAVLRWAAEIYETCQVQRVLAVYGENQIYIFPWRQTNIFFYLEQEYHNRLRLNYG